MSKFNVGDRPWLTSAGNREVNKPCPICAGQRTVTLILGIGEHVTLPCEYCGKGWEGPRGYITEIEWHVGAEQLTIGEVRTTATANGEESEYLMIGNRWAQESDIHETEAEARAACETICAKLAEDERTRADHIKANTNKNYSWNAGYHLREAARHEKQAAYHREKAVLCKAKAKAECGPTE